MKPMITRFQKVIILLLCLFMSQSLYSDVTYKKYAKGIQYFGKYVYTYGTALKIDTSIPDDTTLVGYIQEYDAGAFVSLDELSFYTYGQNIEQFKVDKEGNFYVSGEIIDTTMDITFLSTDKDRIKKGNLIISKISSKSHQIEYSLLIPYINSQNFKIDLDTNNQVVFLTNTKVIYNTVTKAYSNFPDNYYCISDNAYQKNQYFIEDNTLIKSSNLYIGKLSVDGKNIEFGTFYGTGVYDYPNKILVDTSTNYFFVLAYTDISNKKFGLAKTTDNAFQKDLDLNLIVSESFETILNPSLIIKFDDKLNFVKYCSYYQYGKITDAVITQSNQLAICGWNKYSIEGISKGSFKAVFRKYMKHFESYSTIIPNDYLDTLRKITTVNGIEVIENLDNKIDYYISYKEMNGIYVAGTSFTDINGNITENSDIVILPGYTDRLIHWGVSDNERCFGLAAGPNICDADWFFILGSSDDYNFLKKEKISPFNNDNDFIHSCNWWLDVKEVPSNYNFSLYPNPTENIVFVDINSTTDNNNISIINQFGEVLYSIVSNEAKTNIDVSSLPVGIYYIRIGASVRKFIKI